MKYSAEDFENAKFAEHPDGLTARRTFTCSGEPRWSYGGAFVHDDRHMADAGWIPVPTKPTLPDSARTITESTFRSLADAIFGRIHRHNARTFTEALGIEIVPDPEPTNTDNLTELMKEVDQAIGLGVAPRTVAKYLNDHGVTAPNVKGS